MHSFTLPQCRAWKVRLPPLPLLPAMVLRTLCSGRLESYFTAHLESWIALGLYPCSGREIWQVGLPLRSQRASRSFPVSCTRQLQGRPDLCRCWRYPEQSGKHELLERSTENRCCLPVEASLGAARRLGRYFANPSNDWQKTTGFSTSTPLVSSNDG